jgi:two-component system, cell cycle sensor histidine kinase and response regulator CckA
MLRTLIDNLPDGVFLKDRESRFIFANQAIADLMGAPDPSALKGKTDHDFYPKEVADMFLADERVVIENRKKLVNREEFKSRSGKLRWLTTKVPVLDSRGEVAGLLGISRTITERHEAEEALRRSEHRFRELVDQSANGIFLLDENFTFLMANAEFCEMLGYELDELLRLNILDTYPEELRDAARARNDEIKSGEKLRFERVIRRKDGSVFPAEMNARRLADGTMQAVAQDITERKRLTQSLQDERELLHTLIDSLPDLVFVKDRQSRFVLVNRSLAQFSGASDPAELIGKSDRDYIPAELADKYVADDRKVMETGQGQINNEELSTFAPGSSHWILTTKVPLMDKGGNVTGLVGISRDITERKQAEQRLVSLARFPDEDPQPILRVTPDGSIIYSNTASELLTASWAGGAERKIPEGYLHDVTFAWETGEKKEIEVRESSRMYVITIVPFTDAGYINLYGRDVTEEKTLSEMLTQSQKMEAIGQLTGGIAHDFNNMLQAISGYCEVLKRRITDENQKYLEEITKAANKAAALTARLLAFSRKQVLTPQVVNTEELVRSIQKMLERVLGEDIELGTFVEPNTGNFLADPGQIEQVLMNLVVNARDAMPSGGKLRIETSNCVLDDAYARDHPGAKAGKYVCIAVGDTGIGMDRGTLSHIYEPFFTTKEVGKGTGLGLSIVYGIVKQSSGYITCDSETGRGTTFTIYLPSTPAETDKPLVSASGKTAPKGTETILFVDDEPSVRNIASMMLETAGYLVMEASGGEEALSVASARRITVALLITDVVMPRMGGSELARRLQESYPKLKVLYVSGYTADVISHHGILEASVNYLQKPFKSLEFLTKVREILDRP